MPGAPSGPVQRSSSRDAPTLLVQAAMTVPVRVRHLRITGFSDEENHTMYHLRCEVKDMRFRVKRRFKEFLALHDLLAPALDLPTTFPVAKTVFPNEETKVARQQGLQDYLKVVVSICNGAVPRALAEFLGINPDEVTSSPGLVNSELFIDCSKISTNVKLCVDSTASGIKTFDCKEAVHKVQTFDYKATAEYVKNYDYKSKAEHTVQQIKSLNCEQLMRERAASCKQSADASAHTCHTWYQKCCTRLHARLAAAAVDCKSLASGCLAKAQAFDFKAAVSQSMAYDYKAKAASIVTQVKTTDYRAKCGQFVEDVRAIDCKASLLELQSMVKGSWNRLVDEDDEADASSEDWARHKKRTIYAANLGCCVAFFLLLLLLSFAPNSSMPRPPSFPHGFEPPPFPPAPLIPPPFPPPPPMSWSEFKDTDTFARAYETSMSVTPADECKETCVLAPDCHGLVLDQLEGNAVRCRFLKWNAFDLHRSGTPSPGHTFFILWGKRAHV
ncbi:hypothetical protein AB1Y20_023357 [Prymnesium parvum]|uniref:PX domain-containing protein n=1 Tax=Prymnesium parvum TaxID=97485 RepID=A0AB34JDM4_PRYPA